MIEQEAPVFLVVCSTMYRALVKAVGTEHASRCIPPSCLASRRKCRRDCTDSSAGSMRTPSRSVVPALLVSSCPAVACEFSFSVCSVLLCVCVRPLCAPVHGGQRVRVPVGRAGRVQQAAAAPEGQAGARRVGEAARNQGARKSAARGRILAAGGGRKEPGAHGAASRGRSGHAVRLRRRNGGAGAAAASQPAAAAGLGIPRPPVAAAELVPALPAAEPSLAARQRMEPVPPSRRQHHGGWFASHGHGAADPPAGRDDGRARGTLHDLAPRGRARLLGGDIAKLVWWLQHERDRDRTPAAAPAEEPRAEEYRPQPQLQITILPEPRAAKKARAEARWMRWRARERPLARWNSPCLATPIAHSLCLLVRLCWRCVCDCS